jgi:hypothetical protein
MLFPPIGVAVLGAICILIANGLDQDEYEEPDDAGADQWLPPLTDADIRKQPGTRAEREPVGTDVLVERRPEP